MSSKKKKKNYPRQKSEIPHQKANAGQEIRLQLNPVRFAAIVTAGFFVIALLGILNHEMWRDEHQAWLVARDASSLPQLLDNLNYEGNPALWHFFLYWITRVTHDAVYMQWFHLAIASCFIFIFNRYAPLGNLHKILFSFGYFPLYEYSVISRSYALGLLLLFAICALYKTRTSTYLIIGLLLALLSNVNIYAFVIALAIAGLLVFDYLFYQQRNGKTMLTLATGIIIFIFGAAFSLYQIWPETDNSFPASYASSWIDLPRWWQVGSKFFTTYFNIPRIEENFWNTNIFLKDPDTITSSSFGQWLSDNPGYLLAGVIMPILLFAAGVLIFLRKPLILLLYIAINMGLCSIFYYTALTYTRYGGYSFIALIICYWLAEYYPEKTFTDSIPAYLSRLGKKIHKPFLTVILILHLIGSIVAYSMDIQYKFSTSRDAADYIHVNRLDTLPVVGITDFIISPLATYLDTKIYYPQMNDTGSFTIWSTKRIPQMNFQDLMSSVSRFMDKGNPKILFINDSPTQVSSDGRTYIDVDKAIIRNNLQMDLLKKIDPGIVSEEKYYIYMVQKVDPARIDYTNYLRIN